jgi:hypothetical protein
VKVDLKLHLALSRSEGNYNLLSTRSSSLPPHVLDVLHLVLSASAAAADTDSSIVAQVKNILIVSGQWLLVAITVLHNNATILCIGFG